MAAVILLLGCLCVFAQAEGRYCHYGSYLRTTLRKRAPTMRATKKENRPCGVTRVRPPLDR